MAQISTTKCDSCSERNGSVFCYECRQSLCTVCRGHHDKFSITKRHYVTDINLIDKSDFNFSNECKTHQEGFIYYCQKCQCMVCRACLLTTHTEHKISGIDTVAEEARQDVQCMIDLGKAKLKNVMQAISGIDSGLTAKVVKEGENKKEEIKRASNVAKEIVGMVQEMKINEVDAFVHIETDQLKSTSKSLVKLRNECQDLITTLIQLQEMEHEVTFLGSYMKIKNDFENLDDIPKCEQPATIDEFKGIAFIEEIVSKTCERFTCDIYKQKNEEIADLHAEIGNLRKRIRQNSDTYTRMNEQIADLNAQMANLRVCNEALNNESNKMSAICKQKNNEIADLNTQITNLKEHNEALKKETDKKGYPYGYPSVGCKPQGYPYPLSGQFDAKDSKYGSPVDQLSRSRYDYEGTMNLPSGFSEIVNSKSKDPNRKEQKKVLAIL